MRSPALAMAVALAGCLASPPSGIPAPGDDAGADERLVSIAYQPGGQIVESLFEHADGQQGTLLLWLELGADPTALEDSIEIAHISGFTLALEPGEESVVARLDTAVEDSPMTAPMADWAAGTTHLVSLRWDATSVLGSLQHASLRVDDGEAVYGLADPFDPVAAPEDGQLFAGGATSADGPVILRSAFVLRRAIRDDDPPSGVYLGVADEHEAIFAAGAAGDPTQVFGSWDVVFALSPHGDPVVEEPFRGWSHPLADNMLGAGGFMLRRDLDTEGWEALDESGTLGGDPITVSAATGTFNGGYRVENGSLRRIFTNGVDVQPGDQLLLRIIAYVGDSNSGARAIACIADVGRACSNELQGRSNSSRLLPDVLLVGYEVGADDVEVRLTMTDDNGEATRPIIVYSQAELYRNLVVDPGFETSAGSLPPAGWLGSPGLQMEEMIVSTGDSRSGAYGLLIRSIAPADAEPDAVLQEPAGMEDLGFYLVGGYIRRYTDDPAGFTVTDGSLFRHDSDFADDRKLAVPDTGDAGAWHHRFAVGKRLGGEERNDVIRWGGSEPLVLTDAALDDLYVVRLAPVDLALTYAPP